MNRLSVSAPAKINLTLDVLARRPDGYHDIRSLMQTISLHDTLDITHTPETPGVRLEVVGPEAAGVPADETNIVHKAAVRLQKIAAARGTVPGNHSGLHITLTKRIPSQAGLGGGSSDAAATLNAVNTLFGLRLSTHRMTEIAASLGADVPFFLSGGTALVEGLGEQVTPRRSLAFFDWVVIVKPPVGVSTALAYAALDAIPDRVPGTATAAWSTPRASGQAYAVGNDFQAVVASQYPEVAAALHAMTFNGGKGPLLCGSGAAIFRLLPNEGAAERLAAHVRSANVGTVWITRLHRRSE